MEAYHKLQGVHSPFCGPFLQQLGQLLVPDTATEFHEGRAQI